jgi:hypothetical protein
VRRQGSLVAADDGDPHRIVEAPGKDDSDHCGAAVAGGERDRPGSDQDAGLSAREGPGRRREMACRQKPEAAVTADAFEPRSFGVGNRRTTLRTSRVV